MKRDFFKGIGLGGGVECLIVERKRFSVRGRWILSGFWFYYLVIV